MAHVGFVEPMDARGPNWEFRRLATIFFACTVDNTAKQRGDMSSVRSEYQRFLAHLATVQVSDNIRRMANLILANLSQLAEVGATRRARSTRLAPLAVRSLLETSSESYLIAHETGDGQPFGRLHQLEVGPFRGFMRQELFDLERDITLIYGANGTGKSSFCEALETAMLGSINEAQVKRIDHRTYCNNARLRCHVAPRLTSRPGGGNPTPVQASEDDFRFCFIEKNRLDDFARIAARTPADQRQLIATLFGVDQFSDFVRGFNPSLDENLDLSSAKALQLEVRRRQLAASEEVIRAHPEKFTLFDRQEYELAQRIQPNSTFPSICEWMLGTPERPGRLQDVRNALERGRPFIHGATQSNLQLLLTETHRMRGVWHSVSTQLAARAGEVSYSQLYNALLELAEGATTCPACGTDLSQVARDPFEHARAELQQLAQLADLQQQEKKARNEVDEAVRFLLSAMKVALSAATVIGGSEKLQAANLPPLPAVSTTSWLAAWLDKDQQAWTTFLQLVALVEQEDERARSIHDQHRALVEERVRLDGFHLEIERCRTLRAAAQAELSRAQLAVAQFEELNRQLIAEVAVEAGAMAHHRLIKATYDAFLPELQNYLTALPVRLLQGLALQARDLYNSFNRDDPPSDLLHSLWLPMAENGKIELEFAGEPGVRYDALIILSEGHIKCLGLAILLAKNLAQRCPVVIFDDVVNAIDDEHRNGIWRTFFEDDILDGKQIILTSHAEEFLLRIQQELGTERARDMKLYKFLPHLGEHELRVDSNPPTKNYVLLSQEALAREEKRDALRHARPAIESLTDRVWTWLGHHADSKLELELAGPRAKCELNNKCLKLRKALGGLQENSSARAMVDALNKLLGVNGASIEWRYLNTGTHDAQLDHEFDRTAVSVIVESAVSLDAALSQVRKG